MSSAASDTPFGNGGNATAQGSGFVYDDQGHVITNQHVVDGAQSVKVTLWNGKTYDATVVGTDASTDIAVLDVDAPASVLEPLSLADSSKLEVGDGVVAIGSPFGLEQTVTSGIVSALHRQITAPNDFAIDDAIQTDAAINHGNSGGPLLDMSGRVVGVTSQIESESGGNDGVGFAVSSNTVKRIADCSDLERVGRPRLSRRRDGDLDEPRRSHDHQRPLRDAGGRLGPHCRGRRHRSRRRSGHVLGPAEGAHRRPQPG